MQKFHARGIGRALVAAAVLGAAACSDSRLPTDNPEYSIQEAGAPAYQRLARLVALGLQDASVRALLHRSMTGSPVKEGKLHLNTFLRGEGEPLLKAMTRATGASEEEIFTLIQETGSLEIYLPVPAHRAKWNGGTDLIVAAQMVEGTEPLGVDLRGRPVPLTLAAPPAIPALSIVPAESFEPLGRPRPHHRRNHPSVRFNQEFQIDDGSGGGGGGSTSTSTTSTVQQRGVSVEEFITHMRALNDHESWPNGHPEFYLLLAGKYSGGGDFSKRLNIPESPWDGSNSDANKQWRSWSPAISLMTWDTDLGTRVAVQCFEDDFDWSADFTVKGSTKFPELNTELSFEIKFKIGAGDDNCASTFIDLRNTLGQWYYIPDGKNDDATNPAPPYWNGTTDLQWYGYGIKRL